MKESDQVSPVSWSLRSNLRSDVFCWSWIALDPMCFRELGHVSEYPQRILGALVSLGPWGGGFVVFGL